MAFSPIYGMPRAERIARDTGQEIGALQAARMNNEQLMHQEQVDFQRAELERALADDAFRRTQYNNSQVRRDNQRAELDAGIDELNALYGDYALDRAGYMGDLSAWAAGGSEGQMPDMAPIAEQAAAIQAAQNRLAPLTGQAVRGDMAFNQMAGLEDYAAENTVTPGKLMEQEYKQQIHQANIDRVRANARSALARANQTELENRQLMNETNKQMTGEMLQEQFRAAQLTLDNPQTSPTERMEALQKADQLKQMMELKGLTAPYESQQQPQPELNTTEQGYLNASVAALTSLDGGSINPGQFGKALANINAYAPESQKNQVLMDSWGTMLNVDRERIDLFLDKYYSAKSGADKQEIRDQARNYIENARMRREMLKQNLPREYRKEMKPIAWDRFEGLFAENPEEMDLKGLDQWKREYNQKQLDPYNQAQEEFAADEAIRMRAAEYLAPHAQELEQYARIINEAKQQMQGMNPAEQRAYHGEALQMAAARIREMLDGVPDLTPEQKIEIYKELISEAGGIGSAPSFDIN